MDTPKKKFTVHFFGSVVIEAYDEKDAMEEVADIIANDWTPEPKVTLTIATEGECVLCDGTGEVPMDETDSDGNIMVGVSTKKCACKIEDNSEPENV